MVRMFAVTRAVAEAACSFSEGEVDSVDRAAGVFGSTRAADEVRQVHPSTRMRERARARRWASEADAFKEPRAAKHEIGAVGQHELPTAAKQRIEPVSAERYRAPGYAVQCTSK